MGNPVKPQKYAKTAPPDKEAEATYTQVLLRAEQAGLIVQAYGGVATLAIPSEQRKAGLRENVLMAVEMNETAEIKP